MRKLTLRVRITILCGMILIGMAVALTLISVRNADKTYTQQFSINIGDGLSINNDGNRITFGGEEGDSINTALEYAKQYIPPDVNVEIPGISIQSNNNMNQLFNGAEKKFMTQSILIAAIFVILGLISIYYIVGKALAPVKKLSNTARKINENNLYEKIEEPSAKDEIWELTASFNQMLDRLAGSFAVQKNFAANAAHEFRTPLSTVKAGIQVLEMDEDPSVNDYKETVDIIKENNDRLIQIVDNLLLMTRETQQSFETVISMEELFLELNEELMPKALDAGITLEIKSSEGSVKGNRTLIYRAVYNLLENGLKYCSKNQTISLSSEVRNNGVRITVSDNGPGIPKEALVHIFEPFYRLDQSRSRSVGGSGLGLSIVKSIVEKHNGIIRVESTLGLGTTFYIELE